MVRLREKLRRDRLRFNGDTGASYWWQQLRGYALTMQTLGSQSATWLDLGVLSSASIGADPAVGLLVISFLTAPARGVAAERWPQLKYDSRHSGNVPGSRVVAALGLIGAVPLTDAVFTAPVVADGRVYAVDGSGVAFCLDSANSLRNFESIEQVWTLLAPRACMYHLKDYHVTGSNVGFAVSGAPAGAPIFSNPPPPKTSPPSRPTPPS